MAAAWEFVMMSEYFITSQTIAQISKAFEHQIAIRSIASIDDWGWSNQQKLDDIFSIEQKINEGKIITVGISSHIWKSLGLYIEKEDDIYIYTLWLNTEGFPEIDANRITDQNQKHYETAFSILESLVEKYNIQFKCIAIGLESEIRYCPDMMRMISGSSGVVAWLIHSSCMIDLLDGSKRVSLSREMDVIIR